MRIQLKLIRDEIRPYFREMIGNLIAFNDRSKIQMTLKLLFISIKDTGEERDMCLKSENIIATTSGSVDYLIQSIFNSLLLDYQNNLFEKIKVSIFYFSACQ